MRSKIVIVSYKDIKLSLYLGNIENARLGLLNSCPYISGMTDALYNNKILALAAGLEKRDRLVDPDISVTVSSALCGSRVKVDLCMKDGLVTDYGQEVRACALGQSSAALMKQIVVGQSVDSVRRAAEQMRQMLSGNTVVPDGDWSQFEALLPAKDHRSRHASILLPFDGVLKAAAALQSDDHKETAEHAG